MPSTTTKRVTARLATLERHLQRYVARWRTMTPPGSPAMAKRRQTVRRHWLHRHFRTVHALRELGHERFYDVQLSPEESATIERLLQEEERRMTTALIPHDPHLDTLYMAQLRCVVCEQRPWTQRAQYCDALVCADCASGEPEPEED